MIFICSIKFLICMKVFRTKSVNDTEAVYSILTERYPNRQVEVEFDDNKKEYTLKLTDKEYYGDPEIPVDVDIKVVYGDSVTASTPLVLKKDGSVYIETIENIFLEDKSFSYPGFKIFDKSVRLEKEYSLSDYQIWSDKGWVNISKVIRHKTNKRIYDIATRNGYVSVTEDHSLLDKDLNVLKPTQVNRSVQLLTNYPKQFENTYKKMYFVNLIHIQGLHLEKY